MKGRITPQLLHESVINMIKNSSLRILRNSVDITQNCESINIGVKEFNKDTDTLLVFENSTYIENDHDYRISDDSKTIYNPNGDWVIDPSAHFDFLVFKNVPTINGLDYYTKKEVDILTSSLNNNYMKKVCIYYGYPIAINGVWDVNKAVSIYKNYDIIVFGDEYNDPNHESYPDTVKIINQLRTLYPEIELFGYVPTAVEGGTKNLSTDTIKHLIDLWHNLGVTGIFYDEFGFDYKNTRERQNELVLYGKSKGLNAFVNSWEDKYVFSTKPITIEWMPGFEPNPKGVAPVLDEGDYSLYENLFWSVDNGVQKSAKAWRVHSAYDYYNKVQDEYGMSYYEKFKTQTISLDGLHSTKLSKEDKIKYRTISIIACRLFNITGVAFGDQNWGSNGQFEEWDLPVMDLYEDSSHPVTVKYEGYPVEYTATVKGQNLKLVWRPVSSTSMDINTGDKHVELNSVTITNCWSNIYDIIELTKQNEKLIAGLRTDLTALQTEYKDLVSKLESKGII